MLGLGVFSVVVVVVVALRALYPVHNEQYLSIKKNKSFQSDTSNCHRNGCNSMEISVDCQRIRNRWKVDVSI